MNVRSADKGSQVCYCVKYHVNDPELLIFATESFCHFSGKWHGKIEVDLFTILIDTPAFFFVMLDPIHEMRRRGKSPLPIHSAKFKSHYSMSVSMVNLRLQCHSSSDASLAFTSAASGSINICSSPTLFFFLTHRDKTLTCILLYPSSPCINGIVYFLLLSILFQLIHLTYLFSSTHVILYNPMQAIFHDARLYEFSFLNSPTM